MSVFKSLKSWGNSANIPNVMGILVIPLPITSSNILILRKCVGAKASPWVDMEESSALLERYYETLYWRICFSSIQLWEFLKHLEWRFHRSQAALPDLVGLQRSSLVQQITQMAARIAIKAKVSWLKLFKITINKWMNDKLMSYI